MENESQSKGKPVAKEFFSEVCVPFPSQHHASMVKDCLDVDEELQPNRLSKVLIVENNVLKIKFEAADLKILRVGMSSFFDMIIVASKTLLEFEDDIVT